jgi:hypothetical protein
MSRWLLLVVLLVGFGFRAEAQTPAATPAAPPPATSAPVADKPAADKPDADKPPAKPVAKKKPAKPAAKKTATAAPPPPPVPPTPEEQARLAYRAQLNADIARAQGILVKQQSDLATQQEKLKSLYSSMIDAVSQEETADPSASASGSNGAGAASGSANGSKKELSPAVKASVSYEAQTYQVQVARTAVLTTQKEIARLQGFLTRMQ